MDFEGQRKVYHMKRQAIYLFIRLTVGAVRVNCEKVQWIQFGFSGGGVGEPKFRWEIEESFQLTTHMVFCSHVRSSPKNESNT